MRTGASALGFGGGQGDLFICQSMDGVQHLKNQRIDHAVVDIPAIPPILDQACFAQNRDLLRDVGLAQAQVGREVADAMLRVAQ